jgi:hypothetical protein
MGKNVLHDLLWYPAMLAFHAVKPDALGAVNCPVY